MSNFSEILILYLSKQPILSTFCIMTTDIYWNSLWLWFQFWLKKWVLRNPVFSTFLACGRGGFHKKTLKIVFFWFFQEGQDQKGHNSTTLECWYFSYMSGMFLKILRFDFFRERSTMGRSWVFRTIYHNV